MCGISHHLTVNRIAIFPSHISTVVMSINEMKKVCEHSKEQTRWNQKGQGLIEEIQKHPNRFIVDGSLYSPYQIHQDLVKSMGPLKGKRVLDLGSGRGKLSVFLAKQGAKTMGVDLGPQLIAGAKSLAAANQVDCDFQEANVSNLPFEANSYDIVIGLGILHHLSQSDLKKALQETYRVLKKNGVAFFCEPVENSKVFDFIQNMSYVLADDTDSDHLDTTQK